MLGVIPRNYNQLDNVFLDDPFSEPQTDTEYHSVALQEEILCTTGGIDQGTWICGVRVATPKRRSSVAEAATIPHLLCRG